MSHGSSKSTLLLLLLLVFADSLLAVTTKSEADVLFSHIDLGETEPAFWHLTKMYEARGVEFPQEGSWKLKLKVNDYKEIINRYSNGNVSIEVSRMATPREARDYWDNWSKVLAAGGFDQDKFFRDDRERYILANYNVLILSAHEIGHYFDFLYKMSDRDYGGGFLHDNDPMNCSEGYADRIAIATINELSSDKRFAELRERYIELIKTFNASIPAANRYSFDSIDLAGKRCGEIDLMKNGVNEDGRTVNENFFRQYASAYFNRHSMMLSDKSFGGLNVMLERDLFAPFFSRLDPAPRKFSLKTLKEFEPAGSRDICLGGFGLREAIDFDRRLEEDLGTKPEAKSASTTLKHTFIDAAGAIGRLELSWSFDRPTAEMEEIILREKAFDLTINGSTKKIAVPGLPVGGYNFSAFAATTRDRFVLVLTPFDLERRYEHLLLVLGERKGDKWTTRTSSLKVPGVADADEIGGNWFVTESGKVRFVRIERKPKAATAKLSIYELNDKGTSAKLIKAPFAVDSTEGNSLESMKKGLWRKFSWEDGIFGNDAGELFIVGREEDLQLSSDIGLYVLDQKPRLLLGHISGVRDGDNIRKALVTSIASPRAFPNRRISFIDNTRERSYLRQIELNSNP